MQTAFLFRALAIFALATIAAAGLTTTTPQLAAQDRKAEEGWVPLFNGKDFTGWKIPDPPSGNFKGVKSVVNDAGKVVGFVGINKKDGKEVTLWQIKDGMIVGGGPASHIFTEIEADNFHYRVEAKINDKGNSGQYFRTAFGPGFPKGYEAQINATGGDKIKTGSLYIGGLQGPEEDVHQGALRAARARPRQHHDLQARRVQADQEVTEKKAMATKRHK
jgi:hypothetical protein